MNLLMTASQIRGLPVVTVQGGEDIAEVRDVIYSPEAGRLVGLTLNQRGLSVGAATRGASCGSSPRHRPGRRHGG